MRTLGTLLAALLLLAGCPKKDDKVTPPTGGSGGDGGGGAAPVKGPALLAVGTADPFARMQSDSAKALNAGYKALNGKNYDECRASFGQVVQLLPDYSTGRWLELRCAALGGKYDDVATLWSELLARDFVSYVGKLDKPKDLTALRASAAWARIKESEAAYRAAYATGLDRGIFFVARKGDSPKPELKEGKAKLELKQEIYHFDPAATGGGRYRRLTETDGKVYALNVSPDRKRVIFLVTPQLSGPPTQFHEPSVGAIELATLETTGPFKIKGSCLTVTLGFTAKGEAVWACHREGGDEKYVVDSARTALATMTEEFDDKHHITRAGDGTVEHVGGVESGATIGGDGKSLAIEGVEKPLRSSRTLSPASIEWSPGKKRLAYSGTVDACKLLKDPKGEKNELYVWDREKQAVTRVAAAVSQFDTLWLDDDTLVYEGGVGKEGKLHVYTASTRADVALKTRSGSGLYGYPPTPICDVTPEEEFPSHAMPDGEPENNE